MKEVSSKKSTKIVKKDEKIISKKVQVSKQKISSVSKKKIDNEKKVNSKKVSTTNRTSKPVSKKVVEDKKQKIVKKVSTNKPISKKVPSDKNALKKVEETDLSKLEIDIRKDISKPNRKLKPKHSNIKIIFLMILLIILILVFISLHMFKPDIYLNGDSEVEVLYGSKYEDLGAKADLFNNDLTDKISVHGTVDTNKIGSYEIVYTVKSGLFENKVKRTVVVVDKEAPVITLKGGSTIYIGLDEVYKEPGYVVSDNCSSNLDDKVVISGKVANGVKGTYTITYSVEDEYNNKTTITRKVIVSNKTNPNSGVYGKGVIYLTFDDGPSNLTTAGILDILKEEGVKATFFVTNNGSDYLIKRMYDEGHTVALHTASHNYGTVYGSVESYFNDLKKVSDRVKRITGYTSKIVRFPGGSSNTISRRYTKGIMTTLTQELFNRGYRYYDWNVDSGDASTSNTKDKVYSRVTRNLSKDKMNMVLLHDIKYQTRDALRDIIRYGKENGYSFDSIDMNTYMIRQKVNN